jgi:hypothetical protein
MSMCPSYGASLTAAPAQWVRRTNAKGAVWGAPSSNRLCRRLRSRAVSLRSDRRQAGEETGC